MASTATHPPNTYSICFRIVRDPTHWQRRKRLLRAVADEAMGAIWARTTSTIVMRSRRQADDLLTTLIYRADLGACPGNRLDGLGEV